MKKFTFCLVEALSLVKSLVLVPILFLLFVNFAIAQTPNAKFNVPDSDLSNLLIRPAASIERHRLWLDATNGTGLFSQTLIGYMTGATSGVDAGIDGRYINDGDIAFSSLIDNVEYAIQGRALPFNVADVVPLGFKVVSAGTYTIAIDHIDGLFSLGQSIYLKDNLTNTLQNLSVGSYSFSSNAGTFNSRFEIVYQNLLMVTQPVFNTNAVIVYKQNQEIGINTGTTNMFGVRVFDTNGRLLIEKNNINNSETSIDCSSLNNQVLIIQVTSDASVSVSKKVIY